MARFMMWLVVAVWVVIAGNGYAQEGSWQDISGGLSGSTAVTATEVRDTTVLIAGGRSGVFMRAGEDAQWRLAMPLSGNEVTFIRVDPYSPRHIYAGTRAGVYRSSNAGKNWRRFYNGTNASNSLCRSMVIVPYGIYIATDGGVFMTRDEGRSFSRVTGGAPLQAVYALAVSLADPGIFYAAGADGVYRCLNSGAVWEKLLTAKTREPEAVSAVAQVNEPGTEEPSAGFAETRFVACDPVDPAVVYVIDGSTIAVSHDQGDTWKALSGSGLTSGRVKELFVGPASVVFALCESGVFALRNDAWEQSSTGLIGAFSGSMAQDTRGSLYIVTQKGIWMYRADRQNAQYARSRAPAVLEEPTVRQVQEAAIQYAEVEPEKILQWRQKAAHRAWMPKVNLGVDQDSGDLWHWEGGSTTKECDDVLRKGKASVDWGVSLSWDLSELIWTSDQTSIDSRSKLMVELRNSVLDEVTKLYFERKRLQAELESLPVEEAKRRFEKDLKIQELSASLDGLTGGYFTRGR